MSFTRDLVVVVTARGNRWRLLPFLVGLGYEVANIDIGWPDDEKTENMSICAVNITEEIPFQQMVEKLSPYRVKAVFCGYESGLELTDQLAEYYHVPGNSPETSEFRNNKYFMNVPLRENGIPCAAQGMFNRLEDFLRWYEESGYSKVVVKPRFGALAVGVSCCSNRLEIADAFNRYFMKKDFFGRINEQYVIQEFLEGPTFWVNTVSCGGRHFTVDILIDAGDTVEDYRTRYAEGMRRDDPRFAVLEAYMFRVLTADGMFHGAAHSEVKLTADGPKLVEINARVTGGLQPEVVAEACGCSQTEMSVMSMLDGRYFDLLADKILHHRQKRMIFIYMVNEHRLTVKRPPDYSIFAELPSFRTISMAVKPGDIILESKELEDILGYAMFLCDYDFDFDAEFQRFLELQREFFRRMGE